MNRNWSRCTKRFPGGRRRSREAQKGRQHRIREQDNRFSVRKFQKNVDFLTGVNEERKENSTSEAVPARELGAACQKRAIRERFPQARGVLIKIKDKVKGQVIKRRFWWGTGAGTRDHPVSGERDPGDRGSRKGGRVSPLPLTTVGSAWNGKGKSSEGARTGDRWSKGNDRGKRSLTGGRSNRGRGRKAVGK